MTTQNTPADPKIQEAEKRLAGQLGIHADDLTIDVGDPGHATKQELDSLARDNATMVKITMHRPGTDMAREQGEKIIREGMGKLAPLAALANWNDQANSALPSPQMGKPIGKHDVLEIKFIIKRDQFNTMIEGLNALPLVTVYDPEVHGPNPPATMQTVSAVPSYAVSVENSIPGIVSANPAPAAPLPDIQPTLAALQNAAKELTTAAHAITVGLHSHSTPNDLEKIADTIIAQGNALEQAATPCGCKMKHAHDTSIGAINSPQQMKELGKLDISTALTHALGQAGVGVSH